MPYQAVTLAQLQQQLKDRWESVAFWTDAEATTYINDALRWWNLFTAQWKRRVVITTVANQVWYSVPSTLIYDLRMDFTTTPMDVTSLTDLDNGRPGWEGETTATSGVPTVPTFFAPAGLNLFAIWPADAVGDRQLVVDGVRATPVLSAAGDFLDLGQEELTAILGEALHTAAFKEGGGRWQNTQPLHQAFLLAAADRNERFKASTYFRRAMGLDSNRSQRPTRAPVGTEEMRS